MGTDFNSVQKYFLKNKSLDEIKNRYKNITSKKTEPNLIKKWKILLYAAFSEEEEEYWKKGLEWFGSQKPKFALMKKYFLPEREESFLK